jgi:putative glutamine amidotransferase
MKPIIGLTADRRYIEPHYFHLVGEKYLEAMVDDMIDGVPWMIPALAQSLDFDSILERIDGLLLTGGYSHIDPQLYGVARIHADSQYDPERDKTNLALIPKALQKGVPILGICRGFQELNVALGGTLHQEVHRMDGFCDHREDKTQPPEAHYRPSHEIVLQRGGILSGLIGKERVMVNSLHCQGIDRLGEGLTVEAVAHDGLVEAIRVKDSKAFALAVQWHPEWKFRENSFYSAIINAFGESCKKRLGNRL